MSKLATSYHRVSFIQKQSKMHIPRSHYVNVCGIPKHKNSSLNRNYHHPYPILSFLVSLGISTTLKMVRPLIGLKLDIFCFLFLMSIPKAI